MIINLARHPIKTGCAEDRPFGEEGSYRSVADIVSPESRIKVRDFKKAMKAVAKA